MATHIQFSGGAAYRITNSEGKVILISDESPAVKPVILKPGDVLVYPPEAA